MEVNENPAQALIVDLFGLSAQALIVYLFEGETYRPHLPDI